MSGPLERDSVFCGKCGKQNIDGVQFCVHCGVDMRSQTVSSGGGDSLDEMPTIFADQLRAGKVLAGQYRVLGNRPLGAGGMGEVWRAEDTELGETVAIKVLPPVLARDESAVASLRREAHIGRQLTHHNICRLHSFHSDGELKFIVMEFVDGQTLSQMLAARDDRKMTWAELEAMARQIAEALDHAHRTTYTDSGGKTVRGVLHRDIKPQNIMVRTDGTAKLMDFGIAREIQNSLTRVTGHTSQTPPYSSPEQFSGEKMTPASDVYSFAAVLYECLAGHPVVTLHGDLRYQILEKPYQELKSLPRHVNDALAAAMAKDPQYRPGGARELVQRLCSSPKRKEAAIPPAPWPSRPPPPPPRAEPKPQPSPPVEAFSPIPGPIPPQPIPTTAAPTPGYTWTPASAPPGRMPVAPQVKRHNPLGAVSLALGVFSLLGFCVLDGLTGISAALGFLLGIGGIFVAKKNNQAVGVPVAGMILSALAMVLAVLMLTFARDELARIHW